MYNHKMKIVEKRFRGSQIFLVLSACEKLIERINKRLKKDF